MTFPLYGNERNNNGFSFLPIQPNPKTQGVKLINNFFLLLSIFILKLMDYPIHIDTINMELSILYFKGLLVKI